MAELHKLLERQLRSVPGGIDTLPEAYKGMIEAINQSYHQFDEDRLMLERSLELTSQELLERNQQLRHKLAESERFQQELRREKEEIANFNNIMLGKSFPDPLRL